jgi:hypothetical protein
MPPYYRYRGMTYEQASREAERLRLDERFSVLADLPERLAVLREVMVREELRNQVNASCAQVDA